MVLCGRIDFNTDPSPNQPTMLTNQTNQLQEQIFKMVLRGHIDFKTDPWPKLSEACKDCVKRLLEQDPMKRATAQVCVCVRARARVRYVRM